MPSTGEKIHNFRSSIPSNIKLVAVSKTKPDSDILDAYQAGQRVFGENKAQEMAGKYESLPKDIEWHFIGHLQRNKVKYIAPFVSLIHSIDSASLLTEVNKRAANENRIISCLLQFHIASEESKFGLSKEEAFHMLESKEFQELKHINIVGVMGMATFIENLDLVRKEFKRLNSIFIELKSTFFSDNEKFKEISMGMSNDYQVAIEEGATMIRIGSLLFGERNY